MTICSGLRKRFAEEIAMVVMYGRLQSTTVHVPMKNAYNNSRLKERYTLLEYAIVWCSALMFKLKVHQSQIYEIEKSYKSIAR